MSVKMIALDLDMTTLRDDKSISERTKDAIRCASDQGVVIVIATGRGLDSCPDEVIGMEEVRYAICSNGADIYEFPSTDHIYEKLLPEASVEKAVSLVRDSGYMFESFTGGKAYIDRDDFDKIAKGKVDYRGREYVMETRTPVDDIYSFTLSHKDGISNINIFFPGQDDKASFLPVLESIDNVTLTSSFPSNYELGAPGVSKASALKILMKREGVEREELMAAGDSPNDISMLSLAKVSCAVANAAPEVKDVASYVTASNDDDGVAKAMEKYVFG